MRNTALRHVLCEFHVNAIDLTRQVWDITIIAIVRDAMASCLFDSRHWQLHQGQVMHTDLI